VRPHALMRQTDPRRYDSGFPCVLGLRFFVLVSWRGEGASLTHWFSLVFPTSVGTKGTTRCSLTAQCRNCFCFSVLKQPFVWLQSMGRYSGPYEVSRVSAPSGYDK
jgi:hypothetical protein